MDYFCSHKFNRVPNKCERQKHRIRFLSVVIVKSAKLTCLNEPVVNEPAANEPAMIFLLSSIPKVGCPIIQKVGHLGSR